MNREATLKKAEKLLRDGKLGPAIEEYVRLVDEYPQDWSAVNALGDLYIKANKPGLAIAQFTRLADHLFGEGFLPKAQAVYKKALKLDGGHKHTLRRLAEIATKQGLLADARHYQRQLGEVPLPETPTARAKGSAAATEPPPAPPEAGPSATAVVSQSVVTPAAPPLDPSAGKESAAEPPPVEPALVSSAPGGDARAAEALLPAAAAVEATVAERPVQEPLVQEPSVGEPVDLEPRPGESLEVAPLPVEPLPVELPAIAASARAVATVEVAAAAAPSLQAGAWQASGLEEQVVPLASAPAAEPGLPAIEPPTAGGAGTESTGVLEIDLSDVLNEFDMVDPSPAEEPAAPVPDKPKSLAAVFADMRSAATFGQQETTASAHFQLATRHLEASRWDEAIAEFEVAARAPALRFEAASRLGRLLLSRGMVQEGIDWLERAIEAPAPDQDVHLALMYELAEALEQIEEWARALAVLLELNAEVPQYRDVDVRVAKLKRLVVGN